MRSHSVLLWIACAVVCGAAYAQPAEDTPRTRREAAREWSEDGLEKVKIKGLDVVYARPGSTLSGYRKVMLTPVSVAFRHDWGRTSMAGNAYRIRSTDTQRIKENLAGLVREEVDKEFSAGGYQLVSEPGEDVLEVGLAIRDLHINAPDIRTSYPVDTYALSAGEMTLVAELCDSVTGDIVMRIYDRAMAHETTFARRMTNVENVAEARAMTRAWAKQLRRQLDLARGVQPAT